MADHDELIQHFTAVSGADAERAKFFLESAAWDLSVGNYVTNIVLTNFIV